MKYILIPVFLLVIQYYSHGQLPDCVKERCDSILISELGDEIFQSCIEFTAYKINKPLNEQIENPCLAQSNHRYTVDYKFSFPSEEKAFFTLGFVCDGYSGSMRIQSKYFYRHNQSDLPFGFKDMGLNIVAYHLKKCQSTMMIKNQKDGMRQFWQLIRIRFIGFFLIENPSVTLWDLVMKL